MLRSKLFEENKMQRFMAVANRLRCRSFLWPAAIGLAIMLQALALHGFPIIWLHRAQAQTPLPSVAAPGFSPARPFRFRNSYPPYPPDSVRLGEEGTVMVKVTISENGRVVNAQVIRSSGNARLDNAATGWIKFRWRYYPANLRGKPISSQLLYNIKFILKG